MSPRLKFCTLVISCIQSTNYSLLSASGERHNIDNFLEKTCNGRDDWKFYLRLWLSFEVACNFACHRLLWICYKLLFKQSLSLLILSPVQSYQQIILDTKKHTKKHFSIYTYIQICMYVYIYIFIINYKKRLLSRPTHVSTI